MTFVGVISFILAGIAIFAFLGWLLTELDKKKSRPNVIGLMVSLANVNGPQGIVTAQSGLLNEIVTVKFNRWTKEAVFNYEDLSFYEPRSATACAGD